MNAGDFSSWMTEVQGAIAGENGADVPCAGCTACCTASQFVHIGPDETDTLAHIPDELLFPAPGRPPGHVLLGYDERGHCPMLVDNQCSVYEHRPMACRTYDCRVFPATGVVVDEDDVDKELIAHRSREWVFGFATTTAHTERDALRAAVTFLREHPEVLSGAILNATQRAVLAIEIHDTFLDRDAPGGEMTVVDPDPDSVRVEVRRRSAPPGESST
jgi:Fe-S-cluster containining protein